MAVRPYITGSGKWFNCRIVFAVFQAIIRISCASVVWVTFCDLFPLSLVPTKTVARSCLRVYSFHCEFMVQSEAEPLAARKLVAGEPCFIQVFLDC